MIDEERTLEIYGYTSDELMSQSNKMIVAVCEECGKYRDMRKSGYKELCNSCAQKKRYEDPGEHEKQSITMKKHWEDPESRKKASVAQIKRWENPEERDRQSITMKKHWEDPEEHEKQSIAISGENHPNWQGGISFGKYCPRFNNDIKQQIRNKYDNCDYISGLPAHICNPDRKLDVHHIDYNKLQGCDEHKWILIPLSMVNHRRTNFNRSFWNTLFTYSLQHDKEYYNEGDKNFDVFSYINNSNNIIGAN